MGAEIIKRIVIKQDGVYLSSKSSNDGRPFRLWRNSSLSDIYASEGREGADREIVRMLMEYACLSGRHRSLERYYFALNAYDTSTIRQSYVDQINRKYSELSQADKESIWRKPTEKAGEYIEYQKMIDTKMYSEIAQKCKEYDRQERKKYGTV